MRKYTLGTIILAVIALSFVLLSVDPIDTCPAPVKEEAMRFAKHAEAKIINAEFVKTEPSLTGKVVRHYWDVTFQQGKASRTRRISMPVDHGTVCAAKFIN